jgi:hypothetical protein
MIWLAIILCLLGLFIFVKNPQGILGSIVTGIGLTLIIVWVFK